MSAIAGRVSRFSYRNLAISSVETSTPVGCRGAAPLRDAEGDEQNQNDGGRGWFVSFVFIQSCSGEFCFSTPFGTPISGERPA